MVSHLKGFRHVCILVETHFCWHETKIQKFSFKCRRSWSVKSFATAADDFFLWRRALFFSATFMRWVSTAPVVENCRLPLMNVAEYVQVFLRSIVLPLWPLWRELIVVDFVKLFHSFPSVNEKKVEASKWRANCDINRSLEVWLLPRKNKVWNRLELRKPRHVKSSWNNH